MVIVKMSAFFVGHIIMGFIVIVMGTYRDVFAKMFFNPLGECGLAAAGAAGDANH